MESSLITLMMRLQMRYARYHSLVSFLAFLIDIEILQLFLREDFIEIYICSVVSLGTKDLNGSWG